MIEAGDGGTHARQVANRTLVLVVCALLACSGEQQERLDAACERLAEDLAHSGEVSPLDPGDSPKRTVSGPVSAQDPWARVPEILSHIVAPTFPDRDCVITEYGAVADDSQDDTPAIRMAIAACHEAGGGRVRVPPGVFLSGAIHLRSNIDLHLSEGATIRFSTDPKDYLPVVRTRFEGVELFNYSPLVYAHRQENLAITGSGTLDAAASGDDWWAWKSRETDRAELFAMAESGVAVEDRVFGAGHHLRPNFVQFYESRNILVEGVTLRDSPMWFIHPVLSNNITISAVTIVGKGPNNDGVDPDSSRFVLIENSFFDNGDDNIAIKSGRNADGRRVAVASENIVIRNCEMKAGHGVVTIGSEASADVRNVFAENIRAGSEDLGRFLRIKTNSMRGGVIENVHVRNSRVSEVAGAVIEVDFQYEEGDSGLHTPVVRNIRVQNLRSRKSRRALDLRGYTRSPISDIRIERSTFDGVDQGNRLDNVRNVQLVGSCMNGRLLEDSGHAGPENPASKE